MKPVVWLLLLLLALAAAPQLPIWFLVSIAALRVGWLGLIPIAGLLCLFAGLISGIARSRPRLFLFVIPVATCQAFVVTAMRFAGQFRPHEDVWPIPLFLGVQLLLICCVLYRARAGGEAAVLLALFSVSYSLFAAFVAGMTFTWNWL